MQVQVTLPAGPLRWVAPALYLAVLSAYMWREGIPVGRERLLIWIVLGLLALSTANVGGWARGVVLEWLPFALVLAVYDLLRGHADGLLFSTWYRPQLEADAFLFGGNVPTVWLQDRLWHGPDTIRWYDYAAWAVYVSYFVATYLVAGLLWFFARAQFRRYVACVVLLAGMAFATFALFPAAPPWLASRMGELDPTTRLIGPISGHIPFLSLSFEGLYERGSEYANPVAAVPSLHAAYTLLITLFLWRSAPRWARPLLAAYPLAMAFALTYTAEHYVFDILLGWTYTVIAVWVVNRVADRMQCACEPAGLITATAKPSAMPGQTRLERWLDREIARAATPRGAAGVIAVATTLITVGAALLMTVVDHENFPTLGSGLWWAAQTVTTVGYGDDVPTTFKGQFIAVLVMLFGIGFLTVVTAAITSSFIERSRLEHRRSDDGSQTAEQLRKIEQRLERIEASLTRSP